MSGRRPVKSVFAPDDAEKGRREHNAKDFPFAVKLLYNAILSVGGRG